LYYCGFTSQNPFFPKKMLGRPKLLPSVPI
jgi:hypothetical protein